MSGGGVGPLFGFIHLVGSLRGGFEDLRPEDEGWEV